MQTDTVMHIKHFVKVNKITITATQVDRNPNMDSTDMDHWKCVLHRMSGDREHIGGDIRMRNITMTTYFSMGYGHHGKAPEVADVLDCLASGSSSVDGQDFEQWASDLGYDTDSRKAEKTYKVCIHQAARLRNFLGDDLYSTLLNGVERPMTHTGTASAMAHAADEAREVQDACNTSGVVLSFGRHMHTICEAARVLNKGTDWRNGHPICYLFAYKVLALAHAEPLDQFNRYGWAYEECVRIAREAASDPDTVPDYRGYEEIRLC